MGLLILEHDQARNLLPLFFIPWVLKLIYPEAADRFFKIIMGLAILGPFIYLSGQFVQDSWASLLSPLSYSALILAIYTHTHTHTQDPSYSAMLALHAATAAGYLYEVPRYVTLNASIWRFTRGSFFTTDYGIISILVMIALLAWKGPGPRTIQILFVYIYLVYYGAYIDHTPILWVIRRAIGITAFRVPSMILVWGLCLFDENN